MPTYSRIKGLRELRRITPALGEKKMIEKERFMTQEIAENSARLGVARAQKVLGGKNLLKTIKYEVLPRKNGFAIKLSVGEGYGRFRPNKNQDPGKYYAYYQEEGFTGKSVNPRTGATGNWIFRPWLYSRAPVSEKEGAILRQTRESNFAFVPSAEGKHYMAAGFAKVGSSLRTSLVNEFELEKLLNTK